MRACPICSKAYGGAVLPAVLVCCGGHLCVDCGEGHRQADSKPKCAFCKTLWNETPWAINRPLIAEAGIKCDPPPPQRGSKNFPVGNYEEDRDTQSGPKRRRQSNNPGGPKIEECATDDEHPSSDVVKTEHHDTDYGSESDAEGSRFSLVSDIDDGHDAETEPIIKDPPSPEHVKSSKRLPRKKFNCLTGGKRGGYKNPLQAGTPLSFNGGSAFALKKGTLHSVCIKENMNHPLPGSVEDELFIYRCAGGTGRNDIRKLSEDFKTNPAVPIFWEPEEQPDSKTEISYVGHWKIVGVKKIWGNSFVYKKRKRCGIVVFRFVRFDESWDRIIGLCHDKTIDEIKQIDWSKEGLELEEEVDY